MRTSAAALLLLSLYTGSIVSVQGQCAGLNRGQCNGNSMCEYVNSSCRLKPTPAPVRPPTPAPVTPTPAPVTPTKAPVTPTAAPVTPTPAPVTPTPAPVQKACSEIPASDCPSDRCTRKGNECNDKVYACCDRKGSIPCENEDGLCMEVNGVCQDVNGGGQSGQACRAKLARDKGNELIYAEVPNYGCAAGLVCNVFNATNANVENNVENVELPGICEPETCVGKKVPGNCNGNNPKDPDCVSKTERVTICHRTCSKKNPWVRITIDEDAWDGQGCGHQQHDIRDECSNKAPWIEWGANRKDYLLVRHGTRDQVAAKLNYNTAAIKKYWRDWEPACPYVRNGACCDWDDETNPCCGDAPGTVYTPSVTVKKYAGPVGQCSKGAMVGLEDTLYNIASTTSTWQYCYVVTVTNSSTECVYQMTMTDPAPVGGITTGSPIAVTSGADDDQMCPGDVRYFPGKTVSLLEAPEGPFDATVIGKGVQSKKVVQASDPASVNVPTPAPVTPTPAPVTPTPAPVTPTPAPVTPTPAPVTPTPAPVTPTPAPVTPTPAPVTPTKAPVTPTAAPVTPTPAPVTPTKAPVTPTPAPVTPTPAPVTPTPAPVTPTPAPVTPTKAPVTPTPAPVTPTPAPVTPTKAPVTPTPAPVTPTPAPVTPTKAPVTPTPAPAVCTGIVEIVKNNDKVPLPDGAVTYSNGNGSTVTLTITQNWKSPDSISWIAPYYKKNGGFKCDEGDKRDEVAAGTATSYTVQCDSGYAIVTVLVHDGQYKDLCSTSNTYGCAGWGNNKGIVPYELRIPCGPCPGSTPAPVTPTPAPVTPTPAPVTPTKAPVTPTPAPVTPTPAPVTPTKAPVTPTPAPVTPTAAPVTPTPAPVTPTPGPTRCPINIGETSNSDCPNVDIVTVLDIKAEGNRIIPANLDPSLIFYDVKFVGTANAPEVSFKIDNPFDFKTEVFVLYDQKAQGSSNGAIDPACLGMYEEPPCNVNASAITAGCIRADTPYAVVSVFFVSEASIFGSGSSQVTPYECCPIPANDINKPIIEYTLKVYCQCPTST